MLRLMRHLRILGVCYGIGVTVRFPAETLACAWAITGSVSVLPSSTPPLSQVGYEQPLMMWALKPHNRYPSSRCLFRIELVPSAFILLRLCFLVTVHNEETWLQEIQ